MEEKTIRAVRRKGEAGLPSRRMSGPAAAAIGLLVLFALAVWAGMHIHSGRGHSGDAPRGPELWLIFPAVGSGDCMLVQDPSTDRVVLVDTGTDEQSAKEILAAMNRAGVAHLDGIVISSARPGSLGALPSLLSQTRVIGPVLIAQDSDTIARSGGLSERLAIAAAQQHGLRVWSFDHPNGRMPDPFGPNSKIGITLLPVADPNRAGKDKTAVSTLAVRIDYGATSVLDTAALTPEEEDRLLAAQGQALGCDVLAVADGGSAQAASSEFLAVCAPRIAAITSSADHPPSDDALARLHAADVDVGRTDLLGSFVLRLSRYPEEPILWSVAGQPGEPTAGGIGHPPL